MCVWVWVYMYTHKGVWVRKMRVLSGSGKCVCVCVCLGQECTWGVINQKNVPGVVGMGGLFFSSSETLTIREIEPSYPNT